jgi:hypothetical protein
MKKSKYVIPYLIVFGLLSFQLLFGQENLESGFQNPPAAAKARTWWHWLSGNISKSGITADIEAMKKVGIQEVQLFNVHLDLPQGPIKYLSPEWLDYVHFAASEAKRLGLEVTFHNSAGWSSSGGPWMTPEYAMQKVVYSEQVVMGNQSLKTHLLKPETKLDYYKDIAVLAFPKPKVNSKIDGLDYKNLSGRIRNHLLPDLKTISAGAIINESDIINISSKVSKEGFLDWDVPQGEWVILRLGHTPTGKNNHPAPDGGVGLECDKMSKKAVGKFWDGGIQPILDKLGDLVGTTVNNCLIDSYEVGTANWTPGFDHKFENLRGYELNAYLPTLAGYYVESGEVTERFLWDYRRTIGDLIASNYYAHFGELCHKNKLKFSVEPYWGPFDNMQVGETGDIVMCEFWSGGYPFFDSPKFVSSIAHLNGSSIVGAESFTGIGGWDEHPAVLKSIGDRAWAEGINRFIFHSYVHQPWNVAPGLGLSYHGTDFNRLNTWWLQSKAYMDYIARSQFLLQTGKSVSDVLVFTGESSPNTAFLLPEIKALGYDYDLIGSNKLNDLTVKNGRLYTTQSGPYDVLVLTNTSWMKPETLKKINELVNAGAQIIGKQPLKSPSLKGFPACDEEIKQFGMAIWNSKKVKDISISEYLKNNNLPPDFMIEKGDNSDINFIHRKTKESDIYFIANARKENRELLIRFRVSDKKPEMWNAETGKIINLAVWHNNSDGTTSVPISLETEQAVFIVFKESTDGVEHLVDATFQFQKTSLEASPDLKIISAAYGTFLQEGLVDLTEKVTNEIKGNQLDFSASRQFCDCDPAMGYVKEFRMEYQIGEKVMQIEASEKERVFVNSGNEELKVIRALFGKFKPETVGVPKYYPQVEVTEKINSLISKGILSILISDTLAENRMVENKDASLKITFVKDGEMRTFVLPKGQVLNLSKDRIEPKLALNKQKVTWSTPYAGEIMYTNSNAIEKKAKVDVVPEPLVIKEPWKVSFPLKNGEIITEKYSNLISWSVSLNHDIRYFSGTASYKNVFFLSKQNFKPRNEVVLDLGNVAVIAEVFINEKNAGILWKSPFRISIEDFLVLGKNTIEIKVTNLLPNKLIGDEQLPLDFKRKKGALEEFPDWLINSTQRPTERSTFSSWKHWEKETPLLKSGLLGPVSLNFLEVKILD